tara:strand:+ start:220 stop:378 length:159 start_codon:yes stop_codon:yes gene_type:complete
MKKNKQFSYNPRFLKEKTFFFKKKKKYNSSFILIITLIILFLLAYTIINYPV